ncbi:Glycosyl hydrolase family 26 [Verrucomicrobium sp. GAS474]|uniref:golvesin C-terminal-like domain-containing protein n=1 Tax=Verrucomicrobium sp. GAS474 TaxID=1882831 RepID=UPI000879409E|nr:glycosyl hydrolase [Verrucomicrobium sp. GAS474]SDU19234.1 Glycosyl hydrolase family 26 [Verrucomicrobium sp. GAS474]
MNYSVQARLSVSAFVLACAALASDVRATPVPPSDNEAAPFMGVYEWGFASMANVQRIDVASTWLGRSELWGEEFTTTDNWIDIEGPDWMLQPAGKWVAQNADRHYILSVGMLPGPVSGSGPTTGPGAGSPVSLAQGATGAYNAYFQALAQNLVRNGLANNTIIRLGWEFNGGWYAWHADTAVLATSYAAYWQQIVTTMKAVPGAANLKFAWNGATGWSSYALTAAYPGDAYVDFVGVDAYDQSWVANSYPYPSGATAAQIQVCRQNAWNDLSGTTNNGIAWWKNVAVAHGKPFVIPEWGLCVRTDTHGGLDNPFFIQQMYNLIQDPANNVYFHCYFDVQAGDGHHQVSPQPGFTTEFPIAAALLRNLFSSPGYTDVNIGTTGAAGGVAATSPNQVIVSGSGTGYAAWGTSDNFNYDSHPLSGDGVLQVRLASMTAGGAAQAGVMLRESAAANARYAAIYLSNGGLTFQVRPETGDQAVPVNVVALVSAPRWLMLRRTGALVTAAYSSDGTSWTFAGSYDLAFDADGFLGLAVGSGTSGTVNAASFDNLDVPASVTLDDAASSGVTKTGTWTSSSTSFGYYGTGYLSDGNTGKGTKSVTFAPTLPTAGTYQVLLNWPPDTNRATNVPVTITTASGPVTLTLNQQQPGDWTSLGTYTFSAGTTGSVTIGTTGTNGYVIVDAVQFIALDPAQIVVDDSNATQVSLTGLWLPSSTISGYVDSGYLTDNNANKGAMSAVFTPPIPASGRYRLYMNWTANANRATNVPVKVTYAGGVQTVIVNEQSSGKWALLGTWAFDAGTGGSVEVDNAGTNGYVVIDGFRWEAVSEAP